MASRRRQRVGPEIEHVVQVDVGKQRRDHRALPRPLVTGRDDPVFQDTRLQPFLDQADDAPVADPMLDETNQPVLADFVEKGSNVGVENVVHLVCVVMPTTSASSASCWPRSGPEPVAEPEEVLLVDRVQHRGRRPLDDLVLERGHRQRALPAIRLRYVRPA